MFAAGEDVQQLLPAGSPTTGDNSGLAVAHGIFLITVDGDRQTVDGDRQASVESVQTSPEIDVGSRQSSENVDLEVDSGRTSLSVDVQLGRTLPEVDRGVVSVFESKYLKMNVLYRLCYARMSSVKVQHVSLLIC